MAVDPIQVIQDLAIVMLVAGGMALLFHAIRQPLILGYILAGMILGPYTPPAPLLLHPDILNLFAEVGIVFLLFAVGLEYPLARLRAIGRTALIVAVVESSATFLAGFGVARLLGFSEFDALFLALAISVSSTVVLSKVLEEIGVLSQDASALVLGITVIEDVLIVSALGVFQSVARTGSVSLLGLAISVGAVVAFVTITLVGGSRVIPPLVERLAATRRTELLLFGILGLAFGLSIVSSVIGISVATGAFLAGVLVAESRVQADSRRLVAPLKELFGAIFFVSMGALMDLGLIPRLILPAVILLATVVVVKAVASYLTARSLHVPEPSARRTSLSLTGSGGELGLVVAKGGIDVDATSSLVLPLVGVLTAAGVFVAPYLLRFAWRDWPKASAPVPASGATDAGA